MFCYITCRHRPKGIGTVFSMAFLCALSIALMGCPGPQGEQGEPGDQGPPGSGVATGPGLNVVIEFVTIPEDFLPEITFTATDDFGVVVPLEQFVGGSDVRFTMAYLASSGAAKAAPVGQFVSYVTDATTGQATYDHHLSAGLTENEDGSITYKFETALPADYDGTATHQVGGQLNRTLPTGESYGTNALFTWVPAGGAVVETREISTTGTCNACHTKLTVHGSRTEFQYCIICHQPQSVDPDTGNTVDMPYMIHQIHMGPNLPSGEPYRIIGYRNSVHEYGEVHMPQAVTNCTVCHTDAFDDDGNAVAPHADAWMTNPNEAGCLSCHDTTDPVSGTNHMETEANCRVCHSPSRIADAHITDFVKLVLETTADLIGVTADMYPTFTFSAFDTDGNAITDLDDTTKYTVGYLLGWPTSDYQTYVGDSAIGNEVTNHGDGTYTYVGKPGEEVTAAADESLGFVFRGRSMADLDGDEAYETRVPMEAPAPVFFRLDGGTAEARRTVVTDEKCAACHGEPFAGHGSDRIGVAVCQLCHNTTLTSTPDVGAEVTVNLKDMIHMIHTGSNLQNGYTTGGHGGDVDFTEIHFPGRREQCTICHVDGTQLLPLPDGVMPTVVGDSVEAPVTAACTTCHDGVVVGVHAFLATMDGMETCEVCHGEGSAFDVGVVHQVD